MITTHCLSRPSKYTHGPIDLATYAAAVVLAYRVDTLLSAGYHLLTVDGRPVLYFDEAIQAIMAGLLISIPQLEPVA